MPIPDRDSVSLAIAFAAAWARVGWGLAGHSLSRLSGLLRTVMAFGAVLILQVELPFSVPGAAIILAIFALQYLRNIDRQRWA